MSVYACGPYMAFANLHSYSMLTQIPDRALSLAAECIDACVPYTLFWHFMKAILGTRKACLMVAGGQLERTATRPLVS